MISNWKTTAKGWDDFWFAPQLPESLTLTRMICGFVAAVHFSVWLAQGAMWFGKNGWFNVEAGRFLIGDNIEGTGSVYRWSILYWFPDSSAFFAGCGLLASCAVIAGVGSRLSPFVVWFCLCTFHHRAPLLAITYEPLLVAFMAYLTIDPGRLTWLRPGLASGESRMTVNFVVQLMKCHLWIWIAFSLSGMLSHSIWWNGEAGWILLDQQYGWLNLSDGWKWMAQLLTHATIASQVAILFCMTQSMYHWLGRWMLFIFVASVLLLLNNWMYASLLVAASLVVWPVPFPYRAFESKPKNGPT